MKSRKAGIEILTRTFILTVDRKKCMWLAYMFNLKIENKLVIKTINDKRIELWKEHISQAGLNVPEHMGLWKECPQNKEGELLTEEGQGEERD